MRAIMTLIGLHINAEIPSTSPSWQAAQIWELDEESTHFLTDETNLN